MLRVNIKLRCEKRSIAKAVGPCRLYSTLQSRYADILQAKADIKEIRCNYALDKYENHLAALRPSDCVVCVSIDRLGRNYTEIQREWQHITQTLQCDIKILDMPLLDTTNGNKNLDRRFIADLVLQILAYIAERERMNIRARQQSAIRLAIEKRGVHFWRIAVSKPENWDVVIAEVEAGRLTATAAMKQLNLKRTTFYKLWGKRTKDSSSH